MKTAEFVITASLAAALCWFIRAAGSLTSRLKWVYTGKTQSYLSGFEISKSPKTLHTGRWEICQWVTHMLSLGKFTFKICICRLLALWFQLSPLSVDYAVVHMSYCVTTWLSYFKAPSNVPEMQLSLPSQQRPQWVDALRPSRLQDSLQPYLHRACPWRDVDSELR